MGQIPPGAFNPVDAILHKASSAISSTWLGKKVSNLTDWVHSNSTTKKAAVGKFLTKGAFLFTTLLTHIIVRPILAAIMLVASPILWFVAFCIDLKGPENEWMSHAHQQQVLQIEMFASACFSKIFDLLNPFEDIISPSVPQD